MREAPTPLEGYEIKYNKNGQQPVYRCLTCRKTCGKTELQCIKHDCEAERQKRTLRAERKEKEVAASRQATQRRREEYTATNSARAARESEQRMLVNNMDSDALAEMLNSRLQMGSRPAVAMIEPPTLPTKATLSGVSKPTAANVAYDGHCLRVSRPTTEPTVPPHDRPPFAAPAHPPKPDAISLAAMPVDEQRSTLGEHLFPRVASVLRGMQREGLAPKITGMLLHTDDIGAPLALLEHDEQLEAAVRRAMDTLAPLIT